jgi:hypothetical protein
MPTDYCLEIHRQLVTRPYPKSLVGRVGPTLCTIGTVSGADA